MKGAVGAEMRWVHITMTDGNADLGVVARVNHPTQPAPVGAAAARTPERMAIEQDIAAYDAGRPIR